MKEPAVFDNASNAGLEQNAVINTELQNMTHTLGWLQVPWQVGDQLHVEHPHLIGRCIRDYHLCCSKQLPISQLSGHPFRNVV